MSNSTYTEIPRDFNSDVHTVIAVAEQHIQKHFDYPVSLQLVYESKEIPISCFLLLDKLCSRFGINREDLESSSRKRELDIIRTAIVRILINEYHLTTVKVGEILNRDHSTIIHARDKKPAWQDKLDKVYAEVLNIYLQMVDKKKSAPVHSNQTAL